MTMGWAVEDDVRVWIFILSVIGNQWRVLSRRTGRTCRWMGCGGEEGRGIKGDA